MSTKKIVIISFFLLFGCGENKEKLACKNIGHSWCENNSIVGCRGTNQYSDRPAIEQGINCEEYNAVCMEVIRRVTDCSEFYNLEFSCSYRKPTVLKKALCVLPDATCDTTGESYCVSDNLVAECSDEGRYILKGCGGHYCVDSSVTKGAVCAWIPGACSPEGKKMCWDMFYPADYLVCDDGAWTKYINCQHNCECVLDDAGTGEDADTDSSHNPDSELDDECVYECLTGSEFVRCSTEGTVHNEMICEQPDYHCCDRGDMTGDSDSGVADAGSDAGSVAGSDAGADAGEH